MIFQVVTLFINYFLDVTDLPLSVAESWVNICVYILRTLTDLPGSFWTGEAGNAGAALEWRAAGGCELSGDLPVVQWSLCDAEPPHSCSDLEKTQWNHVYGFCFVLKELHLTRLMDWNMFNILEVFRNPLHMHIHFNTHWTKSSFSLANGTVQINQWPIVYTSRQSHALRTSPSSQRPQSIMMQLSGCTSAASLFWQVCKHSKLQNDDLATFCL